MEYAKAKVIGFVMNCIDKKDSNGSYKKYHYSKYYRYGYGYKDGKPAREKGGHS